MILVAAKLLVISRTVSTTKFVLGGLNFLSLIFMWYSRRKYSFNFSTSISLIETILVFDFLD